jgi:hypothetical protein
MFKLILWIGFLGFSASALASPSLFSYSANRDAGQDWNVRAQIQRSSHRGRISRSSSYDIAVPFAKLDLSPITAWKDYAEIEKQFQLVRDERFIEDPYDKTFPRRPTWMYPDDGCFARAQMMENRFELAGLTRVTKIFVFGNLHVKTKNGIGGAVDWWYHVAPIVSDGKDTYVIDPATEPTKPLLLKDWLARMGNSKSFTMAICSPESYTPYSDCITPDSEASIAMNDQQYFLDPEKDRLMSQGRDIKKELGDTPPWLVAAPVTVAKP